MATGAKIQDDGSETDGLDDAGRREDAPARPGRRARLSPAERKRIASAAAAARWGKDASPAATPGPYAELEPTEAILLAATRIFARHGFDDPTMRQISTAAGVGLQTVYRCYPTKKALYLACCAALLDSYMRYFDRLMERNKTPETKLYALALGLSDTHIDPELTRLIHRELLDPNSDAIDAAYGPALPGYFEHYFETARALRIKDAEDRVLALITSIMGMVQLVPVRRNVPRIAAIADDIEHMSAFALRIAFPGFDWPAIRPETAFVPFSTPA